MTREKKGINEGPQFMSGKGFEDLQELSVANQVTYNLLHRCAHFQPELIRHDDAQEKVDDLHEDKNPEGTYDSDEANSRGCEKEFS